MTIRTLARLSFVASTLLASTTAYGWQVYGQAGLPTLGVGIARSINQNVAIRADYASTGSVTERRTEEGIDYDASGRVARFAVFGDWYPQGAGFRVTGGATFNQTGIDLVAVPAGNTINIGGQNFPVQDGDRFDATINFPSVTPYLGIGWGRIDQSPGWHLVADLGISIGRASLSAAVSGQLANVPGIDQAVDRELAELRDGVGKVRVIPQISLGIAFRF